MSLTNLPPGSPTPDDSGGAKPDDHGGIGQPSAEALRLRYEPDRYHTPSVLSVPVLVIVFFVLAFGTTTALFAFFTKWAIEPNVHPQARERNDATVNERLQRIGRGGEVDQPRLEPLRVRTGPNRSITRPEDPNGNNPPYVHPEDSRAEPGRTPELYRLGWADKDKKFAHVPLEDVIKGADKKLFPVQAHGTRPLTSQHLPTGANAGRGAEHSMAEMPKLPDAPEAKHAPDHKDEPKKDQPKKDEPKKELPKDAPKEAPKDAPKDPKGEKK